MGNKRWTNSELLMLGDLYRDGLSYNDIACKLKRSKRGVAHALYAYRHVINVEYRRKRGEYHSEMPTQEELRAPVKDFTPVSKPWWKFWG